MTSCAWAKDSHGARAESCGLLQPVLPAQSQCGIWGIAGPRRRRGRRGRLLADGGVRDLGRVPKLGKSAGPCTSMSSFSYRFGCEELLLFNGNRSGRLGESAVCILEFGQIAG